MEIYTSNYARKGQDPNAIAISRKPPDWFMGPTILDLAPTWQMVNGIKQGILDEHQYTEMYLDLLKQRRFDPHRFVKQLKEPTFLLCYEKPTDFCHRRVLALWIEDQTGIVIPEWRNEKEETEHQQSKIVDSLLDF